MTISTAPRLAPVKGAKFKLLTREWSVQHATEAILARPDQTPDGERDPIKIWEALGGVIRVDRQRAMSDEVDITIPIILARFDYDPFQDEWYVIPIDGWHRILKATVLHEKVPYYELTVEESHQCEIGGLPLAVRKASRFKPKRKARSKKANGI